MLEAIKVGATSLDPHKAAISEANKRKLKFFVTFLNGFTLNYKEAQTKNQHGCESNGG